MDLVKIDRSGYMLKRKIKGVEETEAIRVYVQKDENRDSGVMWRVIPPRSIRLYPRGAWCSNEEELMEVINRITQRKLKD